MFVKNVSKKYSNGSKRRNYHTKKWRYYVYFYDKAGNFHAKRVNILERFFYGYLMKHHKVLTAYCGQCHTKFRYISELQCPKCL